jgi:NAD(P)-dependent dehydrogenase (short-subunit alcohol dehydrogenase family)
LTAAFCGVTPSRGNRRPAVLAFAASVFVTREPHMSESKVAFITGASRGIGKATALALARKGYDVVVTARTLEEGEAFEHGSRDSEVKALPGSLRETAQAVEALGRRALPIRLDLLDLASIDAAWDAAIAAWGHVDVLVNNGIYQGPGIMCPVEELTQEQMHKLFQGNVFSQVHLIQRCLPHMLSRGSGTVVNVVSESGMIDPPGPIGYGGLRCALRRRAHGSACRDSCVAGERFCRRGTERPDDFRAAPRGEAQPRARMAAEAPSARVLSAPHDHM